MYKIHFYIYRVYVFRLCKQIQMSLHISLPYANAVYDTEWACSLIPQCTAQMMEN